MELECSRLQHTHLRLPFFKCQAICQQYGIDDICIPDLASIIPSSNLSPWRLSFAEESTAEYFRHTVDRPAYWEWISYLRSSFVSGVWFLHPSYMAVAMVLSDSPLRFCLRINSTLNSSSFFTIQLSVFRYNAIASFYGRTYLAGFVYCAPTRHDFHLASGLLV